MGRHRRMSRVVLWFMRVWTALFALGTVLAVVGWARGWDDAPSAAAMGIALTSVGAWDSWLWARLDRGDVPTGLFR
jgi:hypothetical protein